MTASCPKTELTLYDGIIPHFFRFVKGAFAQRRKTVANSLSVLGDVTREEILSGCDQIEELKAAGKLFTPDTFAPVAGELKRKTAGVVKALCLHIAHTCNLNCAYCFASQGKYHGERAMMSYEVGKRALDFLVENSGTRKNLEVDFFGGEPLMNFEVVKEITEYPAIFCTKVFGL